MALDGYLVNGTAFVFVGTGDDNALQLLGYTESGVDKNIKEEKEEIKTDLFGSRVPQDYQDMMGSARISAPMIAIDRAVYTSIEFRGDNPILGEMNTPGLVLGQAGWSFPVFIASAADAPWYFYNCLLMTDEQRLATKANTMKLEFQAWPWVAYTATTGKGAPLFARTMV